MMGRTLSHYKVLEELSRGGMGIVYSGIDMAQIYTIVDEKDAAIAELEHLLAIVLAVGF
jgi:hypothetical protein